MILCILYIIVRRIKKNVTYRYPNLQLELTWIYIFFYKKKSRVICYTYICQKHIIILYWVLAPVYDLNRRASFQYMYLKNEKPLSIVLTHESWAGNVGDMMQNKTRRIRIPLYTNTCIPAYLHIYIHNVFVQ